MSRHPHVMGALGKPFTSSRKAGVTFRRASRTTAGTDPSWLRHACRVTIRLRCVMCSWSPRRPAQDTVLPPPGPGMRTLTVPVGPASPCRLWTATSPRDARGPCAARHRHLSSPAAPRLPIVRGTRSERPAHPLERFAERLYAAGWTASPDAPKNTDGIRAVYSAAHEDQPVTATTTGLHCPRIGAALPSMEHCAKDRRPEPSAFTTTDTITYHHRHENLTPHRSPRCTVFACRKVHRLPEIHPCDHPHPAGLGRTSPMNFTDRR